MKKTQISLYIVFMVFILCGCATSPQVNSSPDNTAKDDISARSFSPENSNLANNTQSPAYKNAEHRGDDYSQLSLPISGSETILGANSADTVSHSDPLPSSTSSSVTSKKRAPRKQSAPPPCHPEKEISRPSR